MFSRLHRDEGGNVIVIYVAASLLLVGMVWAIIGTGARVVQKETIQSSADAAAFSASVIKAKGLNIIAFCNLVMALLLALVMLLRAIKYALIGLATVVVSICAAVPVVFNRPSRSARRSRPTSTSSPARPIRSSRTRRRSSSRLR